MKLEEIPVDEDGHITQDYVIYSGAGNPATITFRKGVSIDTVLRWVQEMRYESTGKENFS